MKRSLLLGLIILLALPCFAWCGDIDGIWSMPNGGAVMVRENGGAVIAVGVTLATFGESYDTCVLAGTQAGNTVTLTDFTYQSFDLCGVSIGVTITLTSPTTGIAFINYCHSRFTSSCDLPAGVTFPMEKMF